MITAMDYFREMNTASVILRLTLAMFCGGVIGLERGRKRRAAGFRTYMLVSMGAALTMILGQYEYGSILTHWQELSAGIKPSMDISRFGAQVINGVGFLGAGTIIVTDKQEVKGLTTAAGLWASACMGLTIGAGFYECTMFAFFFILLSIRLLPIVENHIIENARNMNLYVEFSSLDNLGTIIARLKTQNVQIYGVDINHGREERYKNPSAVFSLRLKEKISHAQIMASLSELESICVIEEI